jgi:hypothetical protein
MSGRKGILAAMLASTTMTPTERQQGRFLRAPEGHSSGTGNAAEDAEIAEFMASGDVETGASQKDEIDVSEEGKKPAKPAKPEKPAKPAKPAAAEAPEEGAGEGEEGDEEPEGEGDEEPEGEEKPKRKPPSERIRELNARNRQQGRLIEQLSARIEAIEKGGLPAGQNGGKQGDEIGDAPDPTDTEKYPLGHLDDRYIEDKLEWLATKKAADRADAVLHRQQEAEQTRQAEAAHTELLGKVDTLAERGSELFDDFQETVVDAGLKGEWRLEQPTFEAAFEAENGAQILYELSQDKKKAAEVAGLSPFKQLRWVIDRDAEITAKGKARKIPGAGEPPAHASKGANSSNRINPATDNLDDFEKLVLAEEKKSKR